MQVTAISTPGRPLWRWRITEYNGELVEESRDDFPTLSAALEGGTERLASLNNITRPNASMPPSSTSGYSWRGGR
jgi:hypothetical protein